MILLIIRLYTKYRIRGKRIKKKKNYEKNYIIIKINIIIYIIYKFYIKIKKYKKNE